MPISSTHPLYDAFIDRWRRCRDVNEGQDAVKSAGKKYLPKPGGLTDEAYKAYVERALFYEAVGRTIEGFVGAISRIDPVIEPADALKDILDDVTADGMPLNELTKSLCGETILQGRAGVLVDYDDTLGRAYLKLYQTEAITNWSDAGVVLHETVYETDPTDKHKQLAIEQYRELSIDGGVYTVTLWRKPKGAITKDDWVIHETIVPKKVGKAFEEIPFFWLTPLGKTTRIEKPPLLGLVNVCISHYRNSADLEHGRHFTGLPTPYVTGTVNDGTEIRIGSTVILQLPDANSKVGFMEFTGQGLKSLETALEAKEQMMGVLGAAVFHDAPRGVEAAETARIRSNGETSLLVGVTTAVEATLEAALQCAAEWSGIKGEVEVTLNREYVDTTLDGPTLTALVAAFQAGALSLPQFLFNLQQAELLAPDTDIEAEQAVVLAETAARQDAAIKLAQSTKPQPKPT